MKRLIGVIVTVVAMGLWWLFAKGAGFSTLADVMGLLAIGVVVPLVMEQLIPR